MSPKVQLAISFLQANLHRPLSDKEIAESVGLSTSRLFDLFKAEVGVSAFQYHKRLRLEEGRQLLERTLLSVKEVASDLGYNDCTRFMRHFKKAYGCTPTEYRVAIHKPQEHLRTHCRPTTVIVASKQ